MVGQLTLGKKKYAEVESDIKVLMEKASKLQMELLTLVEKDAEVFEPLSKPTACPKKPRRKKRRKRGSWQWF